MGKGSSGGGGGGSTTTLTGPPTWEAPYYLDLINRGSNLSKAPYPFPDFQVAGLNPYEQMGIGNQFGTAAGLQGQVAGPAERNLSATLGGKYLDPSTNPWLQKTYGAAADAVTNQYQFATAPSEMSTAALTGAFGGSGDATARLENQFGLGRNLSDLASNIYGQNYQNERQNQLSALQSLGGIESGILAPSQAELQAGGFQQAQQQAQNNAAYQNQYNRANYPYQQLSFLAQILGAIPGGVSTSKGPDPNASSLGQNLLGLGSIFGGLGGFDGLSGALGGLGGGIANLGGALGLGTGSIAGTADALGSALTPELIASIFAA